MNLYIGTGLIGKKVWVGTNSFSGKFGDEEASMLLIDGKGVAHF